MKNDFRDFKPTDKKAWLEKIEKDLKGKPLSVLNSNPEHDIDVVAYHHKDDFVEGLNINQDRSQNHFSNRISYGLDAPNSKILHDLNNGVDAISIEWKDKETFDKQTNGIGFEHILADLRVSNSESFDGINIQNLNFDVIAMNLKAGNWKVSLEDFLAFHNLNKSKNTVWISGSLYGDSGSSTIQELAFTLAHLNEYLQFLSDKGLDLKSLNGKINIELSIDSDYFVNIAKFRVIRKLVSMVFKGHGFDDGKVANIYATTGKRYLTINDSNNNYLRQTTQVTSAILGGADVITVNYSSDSELNRHVAKNIPLVLKEESYLDKVVDPGAGSYYIESLSQEILQKSWDLFLEIENEGGLIASVKGNKLQERIDRNKELISNDLNSKKKTLLGVNKYQNNMEDWKAVQPVDNQGDYKFFPLLPFYAEAVIESNTVTK